MNHLEIRITGGAYSGKTELATAIAASLKRSGKYAVELRDNGTTRPRTAGVTNVLLETVQGDLPSMLVTEATLKKAFIAWEHERRAGKCLNTTDLDAQPVGQVAGGAASKLWNLLEGNNV